ncbi:MAG: NADH:flavin oxidoreductase [Thermovirgaceae bacterium]|nr:NADH:flavin oxidoreductase [Synergistales bacterium]HPC76505.1 NADH:flavin oxidoreductase [Synergistales bacterium]HRU91277.1 NADH:flavin oxidoreductase [Thermovirgaceae bacterium]
MTLLFEPLEIRGQRLRNRIVAPPMASLTSTKTGLPTVDTLEYYRPLTESGVGLAILEHHAVHAEGRTRRRQLLLDRDEVLPYQGDLAGLFSGAGLPALVQVNHAGSYVEDDDLMNDGWLPKAPSPIRHPRSTALIMPVKLTLEEIALVPVAFLEAASRAVRAGYSGVEIHAAHGYLLGQFLSPMTNRRPDKYGGSIKNRARLLFEVHEAVREAVGDEAVVAVRLGMADTFPGAEPVGQTVDDARWVAAEFSSVGLDLLDLSGNMCGYDGHGEAWFAPYCRTVKDSAGDVPTICTGGIRSAETALRLLDRGDCDLVGVGRALKSDPGLVHKWKDLE